MKNETPDEAYDRFRSEEDEEARQRAIDRAEEKRLQQLADALDRLAGLTG